MSATTFDAVGFIMAVEGDGDVTALEYLEGMGELIRSGAIRALQGSWQRAAQSLVDEGFLDDSGNLTDLAISRLEDIPETD